MKDIELLSPAGDFECLVSAIQNGANAVYFGAENFNARAFGKNFSKDDLKKAIKYAKLRNVKTHLTLNILIKNEEFEEAINLVNFAYSYGIDAIIVQDLGLAAKISKLFPDLELHASTQMTTYNLEGVQKLEKLGFNRVVLSRELNLAEIKDICENTSTDIEVFIHGALCISYSGQCLISSIIGGRSGNRGKCAGTCRLPYELINKTTNSCTDKGYLLSSKDICSLDILPELIESGVKSFKIEGRMKSPEYVGIVTSIYRKYIDLANSNNPYIVESNDKKILMQIFNRGGFSTGYLKGKLGKEMMYTKKPNHLGVYIGDVASYTFNKGYVKFKCTESIELGDSISINDSSCKISELMKNKENIKESKQGDIITVGRIKGEIFPNDKIFRTVSMSLNQNTKYYSSKENVKRDLICNISLIENSPVFIELIDIATNSKVSINSDILVQKASNFSITKDRIVAQISKTGNTPFNFKEVNVKMDDNVFIPIGALNSLRRLSLDNLENKICNSFKRTSKNYNLNYSLSTNSHKKLSVSLLLNRLDVSIDYTKLKNIQNIYFPFNLFLNKSYTSTIESICKTFNTFLYFPAVTKGNYKALIKNNLKNLINMNIYGAVLSNISQLEFVKDYLDDLNLIANYTFNVINNYSSNVLKNMGFKKMILSPELNKSIVNNLQTPLEKELIVYGRYLLITSEYCPIGSFNNCPSPCKNGNYVLKDRLNFEFPIYTDKINCNASIYNSKITSINYSDMDINSICISILDEDQSNLQEIINTSTSDRKFEGKNYTNGNLNKMSL